MSTALPIVLLIIIIALFVLAFFLFWRTRKLLREAKNYERGLKMVPLLIHLPPVSEDVVTEGRDARDIADENISKAEVLYNIIASITQKGFKSKFYGQRHISLEIVANKGFVYFYAAVPVSLVAVIEQAVNSAYPNSLIEEVAEHNIFNPVGKITGTVGGEMVLKDQFIFPIATYQDMKRDALQSLLNSFANLGEQDGAGVQILIRPANANWTKFAKEEGKRIREGKSTKRGAELLFWFLKQAFIAPVKPPEAKDKEIGEKENKAVSGLDQSLADAVDEKTKHAGYEVLIRVIASSNVAQRSQSILSNITATFSLFDAPGKNGFKFLPAKDTESFVTSYILRFFPPEKNSNILNTVELASIYHFPDATNTPTTQLDRQQSKQADGPRNVSEEGLLLGYNVFRGAKKQIKLSELDRRRHTYIIGETGTGKTTFLDNLAVQDMIEGRGFAFVDPHGDVVEELLGMVPKERTEDVIYFNPSDMDFPFGLNLFDFKREEEKDFLIQETINILYSLYDPNRQGMIGARFEQIFRNAALLLMSDPQGGSFIDIPKVLVDSDFMKSKLKYVKDQNLLDYWTKEWPASQRSNDAGEVTSWVASKFGAFLSNTMMRNIIGQTTSSFDLREIMDQKKILLVNLSKGLTGELNAKLLGMIFVMKFQAAAMSRADTPEEEREDFCLYVDEFQNFSTDSFASILSEARKYRLNLIVANQYIGQLSDEIRDAVLGNVGTAIAFRVGNASAEVMAKYMTPVFDETDLRQIPNYNVAIRMLINGTPTQPFSMELLPRLSNINKQLATALKQLSAAKYGKPKAQVEADIFKRLASTPAAQTTPGQTSSPFGPPRAPQAPGLKKQAAQSSFLDEWLAKRKVASQQPINPMTTTAPLTAKTPNPITNPTVPKVTTTTALQESPEIETVQPPDPVKEDGLFEHGETIHLNKKVDQSPSEIV